MLLLAGLLLSGCEKIMQDMYDQPKYETFEASTLFSDGKSARLPVPGTLDTGDEAPSTQPPVTSALIQRGRERFNIFCAPCHSRLGDGAGMVVQRGFPQPPSFHVPRLREASDEHFYDVITHGYGVMYSYGGRVPPADRRAVIAYIRALQLSQHAEVASLPERDRKALEARP
jgi:mono/diheme cytochrome c family protein